MKSSCVYYDNMQGQNMDAIQKIKAPPNTLDHQLFNNKADPPQN